jgi:AAA family ATP:ADP antiporter
MAASHAQSSDQRWQSAGLFAFFFLVIAAFWVQKPIRTSRFLADVGPTALPLVKLGTAALVLPAMLLYSSLAARFRREALVYIFSGLFIIGSLIFWWLLAGDQQSGWTSYAYFFYVDIFSSVMVALFWSFANDLTTPEQARATYGLVGAGGIAGGVAGSAVTGWLVAPLGAANLLLVCVGILLVIAVLARLLAHSGSDRPPRQPERAASLKEALAGARLTAASPYLMAIATVVVSYEIVSNIIDYQFNTAVAARFHGDAAMAAFLGRFSTASNLASLIMQIVLTSWILRRWGPRVGLFILPLALGVGSLGFLCVPVFGLIAATFFSDAALGYSLNQTTKEVLYTPTDEATKYQAKAFIDMFLMRLAKGVSSLLILASVAWLVPGADAVHWLSAIGIAVVVAWVVVARAAARHFSAQTEDVLSHTTDPADAPRRRAATPVLLRSES